jgi:diphthamide synthase (EF-2-diphthine--ammonia ligase)
MRAAISWSAGKDLCLAGLRAREQRLRAAGHAYMVFGDVDLQAHRDWLEPACQRANLQAVFPLWGRPRAQVAIDIVARGVRGQVVCVDTRCVRSGSGSA